MSGDTTKYVNLIPSANAAQPNFVSMIEAVTQAWADMVAVYGTIPNLYDLDSAVGQQLDVVGQWIGASRKLDAAISGVYFAFDTAGVGFDQGVWLGPYDPVSGVVFLPDDHYRAVLRARILNNHWDGSKEQAYALSAVILGPMGYQLFFEDFGDLSINIGLVGGSAPPALLVALFQYGVINIKPAGVRINNFIFQSQAGPVFAFDITNSYFAGFDQGSWATLVAN